MAPVNEELTTRLVDEAARILTEHGPAGCAGALFMGVAP
jgi:ammonia channel protein AmtB